ncbi:GNAT family N-acetyltransferase [Vibrio sp. ZSDE26]|uniref:GNAT family N-acetyltransferase n=1 Tax=Vibrio amylolyticus TaxID=2847292 RepID=A0A9X2BI59_9VIBR|nr:GNAT family N-acetyltransferase [Vibrio amylolyticus]MCK6263735.1 GNAT family N-acetyltransferase [Vibrio amylolyticus]
METERLILRQWGEEDFAPYAALNADPTVMRYFPSTLTKQESDEQAMQIHGLIADRGWGFWAVELKSTGEFIGFVGLHSQDENSGIPNAPFVEIGWRIASQHWGKGYAPEAAKKALEFGFEHLNAPAIYAFTTLTNDPSQIVMRKVGLSNVDQNFLHPKLPQGHELQQHCLYKITKDQWLAGPS